MKLVIVSGLSGAGKTVALKQYEDLGYYCVDNIPAALLKPLISHTVRGTDDIYPRTAVGLDARNRANEIETIPAPVHQAMGLLYAHDSLYVSGHGPNGTGLHRWHALPHQARHA